MTAQDAAAWDSAKLIWHATLSRAERGALALSAVRATEIEDAAEIVRHFPAEAGPALTPFHDLKGEAIAWAAVASEPERKAYASAAFMALGEPDRRAFLATFGGMAA